MFQGHITVPLRNVGGTAGLLAIPIALLIASLLLLWAHRSARGLSMIRKYQRSVAESFRNVFTNLSMIIALVIKNSSMLFGSMQGNVSNDKTLDHCSNGELTLRYFLMLPFLTLLSCTWFVCNKEARQFISRKWSSARLTRTRKISSVTNQ